MLGHHPERLPTDGVVCCLSFTLHTVMVASGGTLTNHKDNATLAQIAQPTGLAVFGTALYIGEVLDVVNIVRRHVISTVQHSRGSITPCWCQVNCHDGYIKPTYECGGTYLVSEEL
jgi:hypothetical protein